MTSAFHNLVGTQASQLSTETLADLVTDDMVAGEIDVEHAVELATDDEIADAFTTRDIAELIDVAEAQDIIRATHARGSSRWVADNAGIAVRTAQRWMSSTPPVARRMHIRTLGADAASLETRRDVADRAPFDVRLDAAGRVDVHMLAPRTPAEFRATVAKNTVSPTQRAAAALRQRQGKVTVGRIVLRYPGGRIEGERKPKFDLNVDLTDVIAALDRDDFDTAEQVLSSEILEAYGAGMGVDLEIAEFKDGISIE